ncbi:hypothetical protein [Flavobacterium sp.]|uniref:hypothetical protein n=1 Tax=Flavobacterium sp. TaxID=239 RepID=UPI004048859F
MNIIKKIKEGLSIEIKALKIRRKLKSKKKNEIVKKTEELRNIHQGKTIYILGSGPSIKEQNLIPLKDEISIALNEFYLHKDIEEIKPTYFLYTGYHIHKETVKLEVAINWYKDFEKCILKNKGKALLTIGDYDLFQDNGLFKNNSIEKYFFNYVIDPKKIGRYEFKKSYLNYYGDNAAVNAIILGIYMGAKEICLLGLDHDWILSFKDKKQNHFYEDNESHLYKDHSENFKRNTMMDNLINYIKIFNQYESIEKYALKNKINIFNLTRGGLLDVFRTKNYENHIKNRAKM